MLVRHCLGIACKHHMQAGLDSPAGAVCILLARLFLLLFVLLQVSVHRLGSGAIRSVSAE